MFTRLHLICNRFIEAGWLAALVVVPLHFNPSSSRLFEPDKMLLLRSIAVMMALAWIVKAGERWFSRTPKRGQAPASEPRRRTPGRAMASHPIVLLVILFLVSYAVATGVSILPRVSLWGYYERLYGLYTAASFLVIFFSVLALLRTPAQQRRLITTAILVSIPLAVYGLLQHAGIDPLNWDRPVAERVHSTMGNPVFLAATLSLVVPLTLYRLVETWSKRRVLFGVYLLVLGLQGACILFTQSRGPVMGMMAGALLGGLLWTLNRRQWRAAQALVGLSVAGVAFLALINLPNTPLGFVQDIPYLNRLTRIADVEGSSRARLLIWESAVDLVTEDPMRMVVGYGPETIRVAFYPYYKAEIGRIHGWEIYPDRMHNETFDVLVTTGLIGCLLYLLLFTSVLYYGLKEVRLIASPRQRNGFWMLWIAGGAGAILGLRLAGQSWGLSGMALPFGLLGGLFLYLAAAVFYAPRREPKADAPAVPRRVTLLVVLLVSGIAAHFVEINVGIAVGATRLLFWVYTAFLLVLGMDLRDEPEPAEALSDSGEEAARAASKKRSGKTSSKRSKKHKRAAKTPASRRLFTGTTTAQLLGVGLMLTTLAYSLSMNGVSSESAWIIGGLLIFTWLLAGLILVFEAKPDHRNRLLRRHLAPYAGLFVLALVVLFVFRKGDIDVENYHLPLYYLFVFLVMGAVGLSIRAEAPSSSRSPSPPGIGLAVIGSLAALAFVYWTNVQPVLANIHYRKAQTALQLHRGSQALFQYQRALDLDPHQEHYQMGYALLLAHGAHDRTEDVTQRERYFLIAEEALLRAVDDNPYEQFLHRGLAEVYRLWADKTEDPQRRAARYEQALAALADANRLIAENVPQWRTLAETYEDVGDRPQAISTYRQVLAWDSTDASVYAQTGALYRQEQQWREAAAMYQAALRHRNRPVPADHRALAFLYRQLARPDEAVREAERAVEIEPNNVANHETLIDAYEAAGRCAEALEHLRAALQQWPGHDRLQARAERLGQACPES